MMVDQWSQSDEQKVLPEEVEAPKENLVPVEPGKVIPPVNPEHSEGNENEGQG